MPKYLVFYLLCSFCNLVISTHKGPLTYTLYINGARIRPCPVPCDTSIFLDKDPAYKTWAFTLVYRSFMTFHILPPIPNSENSLYRIPSIQTESKAFRTSRKQLKTLLPRSSMCVIVSRIVNDASVQPTPS